MSTTQLRKAADLTRLIIDENVHRANPSYALAREVLGVIEREIDAAPVDEESGFNQDAAPEVCAACGGIHA